ncbi:MAG: hypothetical protein WBW61_12500, partial [Rhodanobacteraceae bacterium]
MRRRPQETLRVAVSSFALLCGLVTSATVWPRPALVRPVTGSATPALYGEAPDGAGYDYIVVDVDGVQVIAPLTRLFSAGTFANNDSSHEYAI